MKGFVRYVSQLHYFRQLLVCVRVCVCCWEEEEEEEEECVGNKGWGVP